MDARPLIDRLARFPAVLRPLVSDLPLEDQRWRPEDGAWSILEIVAHLADEEILDFRTRVRLTLDSPESVWPPIDPEGRAAAESYNALDPAATLARFERERSGSLDWLRSLGPVDWARTHVHPVIGPLRAGDVMLSWVAHDLLHLRQIGKRLYQMALRDGAGFDARYAGRLT